MSDANIKNIELKEKILCQLATSFVDLNIYGIKDHFPITTFLVYPNIIPFNKLILSKIESNIDSYHELMLVQILMLLSYRPMNAPINIYNLVLDTLISKRKDATLKESMDLKYSRSINLQEIEVNSNFKKYILWAEIATDINFPIFRGFGFNLYTAGNIFFKEYFLPTGWFAYSCRVIEKPEYLMTGHNKANGKFEDYKFYGKLPEQPSYPEFETDQQRIKYAVDKILSNLNIETSIGLDEITLDIKNQVVIREDLSEEERQKQILSTFAHLKRMCGI
jgi:hypothetical protein